LDKKTKKPLTVADLKSGDYGPDNTVVVGVITYRGAKNKVTREQVANPDGTTKTDADGTPKLETIDKTKAIDPASPYLVRKFDFTKAAEMQSFESYFKPVQTTEMQTQKSNNSRANYRMNNADVNPVENDFK
jgi:hypothetical protein